MITFRLNDIGNEIKVRINKDDCSGNVENVSSATVITFYIIKPNGTVLTKTGVLDTDGTDGIVKYTTIAGDLDQVGAYRVEVYIEFSAGKFTTTPSSFTVKSTLH